MQRARDYITGQWLIFLIWPLGALLNSFKNINKKWAANILWAFCAYFGFTMVTAGQGADYTRYVMWLEMMHQRSFDFNSLRNMMFVETNAFVDLVQPLLTFLIAQITNDGRILYAVYGAIFGFFYSRNIFYLTSKINFKISNWSILLLVLFAITVPFWEINGFRFWTATHVFLYGSLPYIFENNKSKLFWVWVALLVHFSFFLPVIIFTIYILSGNRLNIYFILFIISLTISELDLSGLANTLSAFAPDFLLPRIQGYMNPIYAERIAEQLAQTNWYVGWSTRGLRYSITILFIYSYIVLRNNISKDHQTLSLFSFSLLFAAFANLSSLVPSGGRFMAISFLFSLVFLINLINNNIVLKKIKPLFFLALPAFLLFFTVKMRMGFDYISIAAIIGNPFVASFFKDDISLINLIK